jgi:hypothetical protein
MSSLYDLTAVIATEAELTEQLAEVMRLQQNALIRTDASTIASSVEKQEELLLPIEGLENERLRLTEEVWRAVSSKETLNVEHPTFSTLLKSLEEKDAEILSSVSGRLRSAVHEVMSLNQSNQYLIEHSRKFVHETFRIVTNGFSRQLIDHKI